MIHHTFYTKSTIMKKLFMKERDIGLKKKKLNMVSFFKFSGISFRIERILFWIRSLEWCQILWKPEITTNVEVITRRCKGSDFKLTAFWTPSKANTTLENINFFLKNTVVTLNLSMSILFWIKRVTLPINVWRKERKSRWTKVKASSLTKNPKETIIFCLFMLIKLKTLNRTLKY